MDKQKGKIKFRQSLFWDVDPVKIDPDKNARYVIERILDLGDEREVAWMIGYYSNLLIDGILKTSRMLHDPVFGGKSKYVYSIAELLGRKLLTASHPTLSPTY